MKTLKVLTINGSGEQAAVSLLQQIDQHLTKLLAHRPINWDKMLLVCADMLVIGTGELKAYSQVADTQNLRELISDIDEITPHWLVDQGVACHRDDIQELTAFLVGIQRKANMALPKAMA